jgi:hypothetical protein
MNVMIRVTLSPLILVPLLGACRLPVDQDKLDIEIRTLQAVYQPLDLAVAHITNHSGAPVFRDLCSGHIEGRRAPDDEWNGSFGSGRACALPAGIPPPAPQRIEPGETVSDTLPINGNSYAGEWRFQYYLRDADGDLLPLDERISNVFRVVRDPL